MSYNKYIIYIYKLFKVMEENIQLQKNDNIIIIEINGSLIEID
jgi:hypothetical protein